MQLKKSENIEPMKQKLKNSEINLKYGNCFKK